MPVTPRQSVVPFTLTGTGSGVAQTITVEGAAKHTFRTDAYPAFGGADSAPSPLFYVLAALTSCNQVTGSLVAKDLGLSLGEWSFRIQGDLDTAVLVGGADGNANFHRVVVQVSVQTDATPEQFERLASETERRCPVTQMFARSGLDLSSTWQREELAVDDVA